jgi:hypothetical protein
MGRRGEYSDVTEMPLDEFYAWRADVLEWIAVEHPDRLEWAIRRFASLKVFCGGRLAVLCGLAALAEAEARRNLLGCAATQVNPTSRRPLLRLRT